MNDSTHNVFLVQKLRGVAALLVGLGLLAGLAACGDDDGETAAGADAPPTGEETGIDLAREYCDATADIEAYAATLFVELGDDPTIEEQLDAERQVVDYIERQGYDRLDLPPEIDEDFRLFYEGFTAKLEAETPEEPSLESQAAEQRLLEWEAVNCTN